MTSDVKSARDGARVTAGTVVGREAATLFRRTEKILEARALGHRVDRIAYDLRLIKSDVIRIIAARRAAGDPRALTDKRASEAAYTRQEAARRAACQPTPAPVEAPAPPVVVVLPPETLAPVKHPACAPVLSEDHRAYIARLRDIADAHAISHPNVASWNAHLADLHEHCPHTYPNLKIPTEAVTLQRFVPALMHSPSGSPAAACLGA